MFDRRFFDPIALDMFWRLIAERMRVYYRREEGMKPPWSLDPILQNEFITNVYRELDPGTQYVMNNILALDEEPSDKLFNIMFYRLTGSREATHEAIGFLHAEEWKEKAVRKTLRAMNAEGELVFGEAYRTASYSDMGSKDKITNVVRLFTAIAEQLPEIWNEMLTKKSLAGCYSVMENVKGFGDFLAYQILVDCLYPAPDEPLLPYDQETWAKAGPGARNGIWRLLREGMKPAALMDVMVWLRDMQGEEFARLGIDFEPLLVEGEPVPISLCNIQSCLCEFYKYMRIWDGDAKAVRRYNYTEGMNGTLDVPPLTFQRAEAPASETLEVLDFVEDASGVFEEAVARDTHFLPAVLDTTIHEEEVHVTVRSKKPVTEIMIRF